MYVHMFVCALLRLQWLSFAHLRVTDVSISFFTQHFCATYILDCVFVSMYVRYALIILHNHIHSLVLPHSPISTTMYCCSWLWLRLRWPKRRVARTLLGHKNSYTVISIWAYVLVYMYVCMHFFGFHCGLCCGQCR